MTTELETVKAAGLSLGENVRASAVGLHFDDGIAFIEWVKIGSAIGRVAESSIWWIGDWCNYGLWEYGKKYEEALAVTGLSYQALADIAWVCGKVDISRRRENLSFTHHREVAALEPAEQDAWLDRATEKGWARWELREAMTATKELPARAQLIRLSLSLPPTEGERVERWKAAAEAEGEDFAEWVGEACDAKAAA